MQAELNSFLLNEVANGILFLIIAVLFVNTLFDRRIHAAKRDRDFSLFVLFCAAYIGLMLVWLPLKHYGTSELADFAVSTLRVLAGVLAYGFFATWIFSVSEMREPVQDRVRRLVIAIMVVLFVLSLVLRIVTSNTAVANVPIFLYYFLLVVLALAYRGSIGASYTVIIVASVVVELLLQAQTWWDYTPANIFLVVGDMLFYSRIWLVKKEERIERDRLMAEQRADLENARTKLVLSQIKPHFLFNTLSTVAFLCTKRPEMARDLCIDLVSYLRSNLSALDSGALVSLKKELEHVEAYLKIEKIRFADTLSIAYDIQDANFKLPALTVEPLVENAVKHGIRGQSEGGTVTIATYEEPEWHVVAVRDDGAGFDVEAFNEHEGDRVGVRSVRKRIEDLCQGTLTIESHVGEGTTAILRIPKEGK